MDPTPHRPAHVTQTPSTDPSPSGPQPRERETQTLGPPYPRPRTPDPRTVHTPHPPPTRRNRTHPSKVPVPATRTARGTALPTSFCSRGRRHGPATPQVPAGHISGAHTSRSKNATDDWRPHLRAGERAPFPSSQSHPGTRPPRTAPPPARGPLGAPPPAPPPRRRMRASSRGPTQRTLGAVGGRHPAAFSHAPHGRARACARACAR